MTPKLFPLSHESYSTYKACPKKWEFKYRIKPPGVFFNKSHACLGSVIHNVVEAVHKEPDKSKPPEAVAEREFYPTFKKFAFAPDVNFAETDWKDAHTARTAFEDFLARTIETLKSNNLISPLNIVEHRFGTYQNPLDIGDGLGLTGGLDLLSPAYDKWRLVDYKSSLNAQNIDLDQLVLYQIGAVTQLKIRPAMAGFLLIRYSSINWTCIDEARENDLRQRLIQFKDNVADSKFDATPSERACKRCDYRDLCPAYAASKGLPPPKPKQYDVSHEIPEM